MDVNHIKGKLIQILFFGQKPHVFNFNIYRHKMFIYSYMNTEALAKYH